MAKRTAKDFSRNQIFEIATTYAETQNSYSHEFFEREYEISKGTFYNILKKAVIENVVNDDTVLKIAMKAKENSYEKAGEAGAVRSENHYQYLIQKRKIYMLSKKKAVDLTKRYAKSILSKKEFSKRNYYTTTLMDRTFMKCIVEGWISDETFKLLKEKALKLYKDEKSIQFWEQVEKNWANAKSQD